MEPLALSLLAGFGVVAVAVVRMGSAVRGNSELVAHLVEQLRLRPDTVNSDDEVEVAQSLADLAVVPGSKLPNWARTASRKWSVMVLVPTGDRSLAEGMRDDVVPALGKAFSVTLLMPRGAAVDTRTPGLQGRVLPDDVASTLPRPAAILADPNDVVAGVGAPVTAADVLAFVVEGARRGHGPSRFVDEMSPTATGPPRELDREASA